MDKFIKELEETQDDAIKVIGNYLLSREDIHPHLTKKGKSLKNMFSYICQEAKKKANKNCACLTDEEVFSLAVHYYDEDDIKTVEYNAAKVQVTKKKINKKKKENKLIVEGQMTLDDFI